MAAIDEDTVKKLTDIFRTSLKKDKLEVKVEKLKNAGVAAMVTLSEESRRMQDMMKMYNMYGMDPSMFGGTGNLDPECKPSAGTVCGRAYRWGEYIHDL